MGAARLVQKRSVSLTSQTCETHLTNIGSSLPCYKLPVATILWTVEHENLDPHSALKPPAASPLPCVSAELLTVEC